jgi:uncharacterized protein (PEP-CTERM system associated)
MPRLLIGWPEGESRRSPRRVRQPIRARYYRLCIGCGLMAAAYSAFLGSPSIGAEKVQFTPTLSVSEEYSSNIDLDPDETKEAGWITRVTPGGRLRRNTSRSTLAVDGGLTFREQTAGQDQGFNTDVGLSALLNAEPVPDTFVLDAGASVSQQTFNTRQSSSSANQETLQVYRVSPALRWSAGPLGLGELRYIGSQVIASGGDVSDQTGNGVLLTLSSGDRSGRLRSTLSGRSSLDVRQGESDIIRNDAEFANEYAVTRAVHPVVAVGYQTFDDHDSVNFQSPTWRAGLHFKPNRRLDLLADYGLRDDRYSPAFLLRYEVTPRTHIFSAYKETLGSAQERLAGNIGFIGIDPQTGAFIDQRSGTPFDPRGDPFDISNQTSRVKLFTAAISHDWRRTTVSLAASIGTDENLGSNNSNNSNNISGTENVHSLDLSLLHRLTRLTSLESSVGYIGNHFTEGEEDDDEYYVTTGLRHRLSKSLSAFASYGYHWQNSNVDSNEFKEHHVTVGLSMEF